MSVDHSVMTATSPADRSAVIGAVTRPVLDPASAPGDVRVASTILVVGGLVALVLFALGLADALGLRATWDFLHQAAATIGAAVAATFAARAGAGSDRSVRRWAAFAIWLWVAGLLLRGVGLAAGATGLVAAGGILWLTPVLATIGFTLGVSRWLYRAVGVGLLLDSVAVFGALFVAIVVATGPDALRGSMSDTLLTLAYPTIYLASPGAVLMAALAMRWTPKLDGAYVAIAGLVAVGLGWIGPLAQVEAGQPVVAGTSGLLFSVGWLLFASGVVSSNTSDVAGPRWRAAADALITALPILALGFVVIVIALDHALIVDPLHVPAAIGVATVVVAVTARQWIALRDRADAVSRLARAHAQAAEEARRAEAAERDQRVRAEIGAMALAASEELRLADVEASFGSALGKLVPDGVAVGIYRYDPAIPAFVRLAIGGPWAVPPPEAMAVSEIPSGVDDILADRIVVHRRDGDPDLALYRPGSGSVSAAADVVGGHVGELALGETGKASVTIPITSHQGELLGVLHIVDTQDERVLDPAFVEMARLAANQFATSMQNLELVRRLDAEIIERDRVREQLVQASRSLAVGELASAVAHEVNNPLTGVLGYAELLLADLPANDPHREDLGTIRAEAVRARAIVRALVDLGTSRSTDRAPAALDRVARAAMAVARPGYVERGVALVDELTPMPAIAMDERAIERAVGHLLDNALAACRPGGTVRVSSRLEGDDRALLLIADDGTGMDPVVIRRAFEPFFTTRGERSGRGMGLPTSLGIVRDHGGTIWIESAPGEGTTVEMRLPIATGDAIGGPEAASSSMLEALR